MDQGPQGGPVRAVLQRLLWLVAVVAVVGGAVAVGHGLLEGGASEASEAHASQDPDARPIVVTRSRGDYRHPMCRPKRIGRRLENFSRALRAVDEEALRIYWDWPGFVAFGVARTGSEHWVFRGRDYRTAIAKLRRREGLDLRFHRVDVAGNGGTFTGVLRTGNGRRWNVSGKAAWSCKRPGIKVISAGLYARPGNPGLCPRPRRNVSPGAMVVCSRKR